METPYLPQAIFGKDFEKVYEPAEDTYLLLDALENDLDYLRKMALICVECGSGSGAVITAISKSLQQTDSVSRLMIATDISEHACRTTKKCATYHGQHTMQVLRTNLADALLDRLENKVDLLVFNPPYVPTNSEEIDYGLGQDQIYLSWAGGDQGRQLIDVFLNSHVPRLLSKPGGVAYLVALDKNKIDELTDFLRYSHSIQGSVILHRKAGQESLFVIKYTWVT